MSGQSVGSLCRRVRDVATVRRIGLFASGEKIATKELAKKSQEDINC